MIIISNIKMYFKALKLRRKFPKSVIHKGAYVDSKSKLGIHAVLFSNAAIIDSSLGDYSYVQSNSLINNANIGKFCSIADGVKVGLANHLISNVSSHPIFQLKNTPLPKIFCDRDLYDPVKKTVIEHDVWIGCNAMIMGGVHIGVGAVIGAGAVVTKDIPAYTVVAGIPARRIKCRFDDNLKEALISSKWWNMQESWLMENYKLFRNPNELLDALALLDDDRLQKHENN